MRSFFILVVISLFALNAYSIDYVFKAGYGIIATWNASDKIGVYAEGGLQTRFDINEIDVADKHYAFTTGYGKSLKNDKTYFAMSPYSMDYYAHDNISTALPISYKTLVQTANDNIQHLAQQDYMLALVTTTSENEATFDFQHINAVLRLKVLLPESATFCKASLNTSQGVFVQSGVLNVETRTIESLSSTQILDLMLDDIKAARKEYLTVYFVMPQTDMTGGQLTATFTTTEGKTYSCAFTGFNAEGGKLYNVERTLVSEDDDSHNARVRTDDVASEATPSRQHKVQGAVKTPGCKIRDFELASSDVYYASVPPIKGDANGDDSVDLLDLDAIVQHILGNTPTDFNYEAADVNNDGLINIGDISCTVNIIKNNK